MPLTPQEREKIYLEEKARREPVQPKSCGGGYSGALAVAGILAAAGLVGIVLLSRSSSKRRISIDALRKAYAGLDPDEIEEMKYI